MGRPNTAAVVVCMWWFPRIRSTRSIFSRTVTRAASWPNSCLRRKCRRRLPPVRNEIKGGVLSPRHGQVNPILTTKSLAHTAAVHFGVEFLLHSAVTAISVADGAVNGVRVASATIAAPTVVLAAGAWTGQLASTAGVACPIGPRRIQILLSEAMAQWTDLVWAGNGVYARQSLSGHLHFGSGGPGLGVSGRRSLVYRRTGRHAAHSSTHG